MGVRGASDPRGASSFYAPALDGLRATALLLFFVAGAQPFWNLNRTS
jgi:hypothetical protein